jgi:hypothetical protein
LAAREAIVTLSPVASAEHEDAGVRRDHVGGSLVVLDEIEVAAAPELGSEVA